MQFYVLHLTLRNFSIDTMREADFNEALVGCDNLSASVECENISQVVPSHNVTEIKINIEIIFWPRYAFVVLIAEISCAVRASAKASL